MGARLLAVLLDERRRRGGLVALRLDRGVERAGLVADGRSPRPNRRWVTSGSDSGLAAPPSPPPDDCWRPASPATSAADPTVNTSRRVRIGGRSGMNETGYGTGLRHESPSRSPPVRIGVELPRRPAGPAGQSGPRRDRSVSHPTPTVARPCQGAAVERGCGCARPGEPRRSARVPSDRFGSLRRGTPSDATRRRSRSVVGPQPTHAPRDEAVTQPTFQLGRTATN